MVVPIASMNHKCDRTEDANENAQDEGAGRDAVARVRNLHKESTGDRTHRADGNILSAAGCRDKRHAHCDDSQHAGVIYDGDQVAAQHFSTAAVRCQLDVEKAEVVLRAE